LQGLDVITMPHSESLEQSLIGSLLSDPEQFPVIDSLLRSNSEVFYRIKHKHIFEAIAELYYENTSYDLPLVYNRVKAKTDDVTASDLSELSMPTGYLAESYAEQLVELHNKRVAIQECQNAVVSLSNGGDFTDIVASLRSALDQSVLNPANRYSSNIADDALNLWENYLDNEDTIHANVIPTGFSTLDSMTTIKKGHHILVGARTSMGKSSFALSWATNVAQQGKKVIFFTMEQSKNTMVESYISQIAGVSRNRFMRGNLTEEEKEQVKRTVNKWGYSELIPMGLYEGSYAPYEIRHKLVLELEKNPVDIVFIDFLHAMKPPKGYRRDGHEWLREATKQLEEIAIELNVTIVSMAQLSRDVDRRENKRPVITDIREAGEDHADLVLFIYRDEYYYPETEDAGIAEIIIAKQRHGPTGLIRLAFIDYSTKFTDIANAQEYITAKQNKAESWSVAYD